MNEGNNQNNNNYNVHTTMNDDAFNIFNQNTQSKSQAVEEVKPVEQQNSVPTQTVEVEPSPTPNLVTVNDYKEPKKPFSFKELLKKKIAEDEKTYSIDDITNFKDDKKEDIDPEELKEKQKKIKDIIILVVALIVLIIVGIIGYNVFTNYLLPNENTISSDTINKKILSSNVVEEKKNYIKYKCNSNIDNSFYNIPFIDNTNWDLYKGNTYYSFTNDRLDIINEVFELTYNMLSEEENNTIINYCNSYNKVLDQYVLLCNFSNNHIVINNTFYLSKIDGEVKNKLGVFKINYTKNNILGDVITSNDSCTMEK